MAAPVPLTGQAVENASPTSATPGLQHIVGRDEIDRTDLQRAFDAQRAGELRKLRQAFGDRCGGVVAQRLSHGSFSAR